MDNRVSSDWCEECRHVFTNSYERVGRENAVVVVKKWWHTGSSSPVRFQRDIIRSARKSSGVSSDEIKHGGQSPNNSYVNDNEIQKLKMLVLWLWKNWLNWMKSLMLLVPGQLHRSFLKTSEPENLQTNYAPKEAKRKNKWSLMIVFFFLKNNRACSARSHTLAVLPRHRSDEFYLYTLADDGQKNTCLHILKSSQFWDGQAFKATFKILS